MIQPLGFSYVIQGLLAGSAGPINDSDLAFFKGRGIRALVRLDKDRALALGKRQLAHFGLKALDEPVQDYSAPSQAQIDHIVAFIEQRLGREEPVVVTCGAGIGRTGTILACYFVKKGYTAQQAIHEVRRRRPGSIEVTSQREAIRGYEARLRQGVA